MKKQVQKIALILLYTLLMIALLDFKVMILFDLKLFVFVMIGTIILTLIELVNGLPPIRFLKKTKINLVITGTLTTFLSLFSAVIKNTHNASVAQLILHHSLGLFYALIMLLFLDLLYVERNAETALPKVSDITVTVQPQALDPYQLTNREREVATSMLKNMSNKAIADELFISENTVKKHIQNILRKTNVNNRSEFKFLFIEKEE